MNKIEELLKKRDDLISDGIVMLREHEEADRLGMIAYNVPDSDALEKIVQPWIDLKNNCIFWHEDIKKFLVDYHIDFALGCEIFIPPTFFELIGGMGAGGSYSE